MSQAILPWREYIPPAVVAGEVRLSQEEVVRVMGAVTFKVWRLLLQHRDEQAQQENRRQTRVGAWVTVSWRDLQRIGGRETVLFPGRMHCSTEKSVRSALARLTELGLVERVVCRKFINSTYDDDGLLVGREEQWRVTRAVYGAVTFGRSGTKERINMPKEVAEKIKKGSGRGGYRGPVSPEGRERIAAAQRERWQKHRAAKAPGAPLGGEVESAGGPVLVRPEPPPASPPERLSFDPASAVETDPVLTCSGVSQNGSPNQVKTGRSSDLLQSSVVSSLSFDNSLPTARRVAPHPSPFRAGGRPEGAELPPELLSAFEGAPEAPNAAPLSARPAPTGEQPRATPAPAPSTPSRARSEQPRTTPEESHGVDSRLFANPRPVARIAAPSLSELPFMPKEVNALRDGLTVKLPAAPLLDPDASRDERTMHVWRLIEGALKSYKFKRPVCMGYASTPFNAKHKFYGVVAKAGDAFLERGLSPAAWLDYWFNEHANGDYKAREPNLVFILSDTMIRQPQGWHTRLNGYADGRILYLPEVRSLLVRQQLVRRTIERRLRDGLPCGKEDLRAVFRQHFPDGFAVETQRARERAADAQEVLLADVRNACWLWGASPWEGMG